MGVASSFASNMYLPIIRTYDVCAVRAFELNVYFIPKHYTHQTELVPPSLNSTHVRHSMLILQLISRFIVVYIID